MGNYLSAWDEMLDRWVAIFCNESVFSTEHPAIICGAQMGKIDGSGLAWDAPRRSLLNKLEFCSMVGHDCDVRIYLYPVIQERVRVVIDRYLRSEYDWGDYDRLDYYHWDDRDVFDMFALWRMCGDQSYTYACNRVEICINFGLAGDYGKGDYLAELFTATRQKEMQGISHVAYEAIGFLEFANRIYNLMYDEAFESPTLKFIDEMQVDSALRRFGRPYRCKAFFFMW